MNTMKYFVLFFMISFVSIVVFINFVDSAHAQSEIIPDWFKNNAQWWNDGLIGDDEIINAIESLIGQGIISVELGASDSKTSQNIGVKKIPTYVKDVFGFWSDGQVSGSEVKNQIQYLIKEDIISSSNIDEIKQKKQEQYVVMSKGPQTPQTAQTAQTAKTSDGHYGKQSKDGQNNSQNTNIVYPKTFKDAITIQKQNQKSVTLLVYMVGSNLENNESSLISGYSATRDIVEMSKGAPDEKLINVVLATGGSSGAVIKGERTIDFRTPSMQQVIGSEVNEIARLGTKTMASPALLSDFIETTVEYFPADKYILIMWNHGYGYDGYGSDTVFPSKDHAGEQMSLLQLQSALKNSQGTPIVKFELIGFDACLMATYEVAEKLAGNANYLVASQENEPSSGWDYKQIIMSLNQNPDPDGKVLGETIISTYLDTLKNLKGNTRFDLIGTLSVLDLQEFDNMRTSFIDFKDYVIKLDTNQIPKLSQALKNGERYGAAPGTQPGHVDLLHFMNYFGKNFNGEVNKNGKTWTSEDTNNIIKNIKKVAVSSSSGIGKPNANGMSLFFPQNKILSLKENSNALQTLGRGDVSISYNTEQNDLVDFYMNALKLDTSIPTFDVTQNNNIISGQYYDDDVYEINFYFTAPAEDGWIEIFHSDEYDADEDGFEYGEIYFPWDGYEPALCNEKYCYPISPDWEWGERDFAYLPVLLYSDVNDSDGLIGSIIYDITDEEDGIFVGFLPSGDRPGDVSKQILDLNYGNVVQIRAVEVTEDFTQTKFTKVEELLVDNDFRFSWEIFDWGELDVFVEVCDFSGNCADLQGPFTMDPRDVPDIDMDESYPSEQNDPLNPIDEVYETYDDLGNYDSEYFDNIEFISMDTFCNELHFEFDDDLGWDEVEFICDDERDYNGNDIDRDLANEIIDEIQYYNDQIINDDSILITYFCEDIHYEFDDDLGWQEVQNICLTASTTYDDSIPIDIADEYWDALVDSASIQDTTSTDFDDSSDTDDDSSNSGILDGCDDNYDGTISCWDENDEELICYDDGSGNWNDCYYQ